MSNKKEHYLMRDNIAKKIFKDEILGKELSARLISEVLQVDFHDIYDNLTPYFTEIGINALTIDTEADIVYSTDEDIINVEINYSYGPYRDAQMNTYVSQLYLGQIKSKKDYLKSKGIIQILIEDYDYFHKGDYVYEVVLKDKKYNLDDNGFFRRFHISLDYLSKLNYNEVIKSENKLVKLLYFLICGDKEEKDDIYKDDDFMKKVIKNAEEIAGREKMPLYLSNEEITRLDMEYHQKVGFDKGYQDGHQKGIEDGIKEGIEQGIEQGIKKMVNNLYQNGATLDLISKSANLSIDEVQMILDNEKKSK